MEVSAQIEATFREEHGRILAALISRYGDFSLAEDALQDALIEALKRWPAAGVPENPGAWLTAVARRRLVDRLRRLSAEERRMISLGSNAGGNEGDDEGPDMDSLPDERLKLMFTCCHPALALEAQVALTLRTLGGLSTAEIARAFLVSEPAMAQRLARARAKIRNAGIPYRIPPADLLPERLQALLAVIYLIFNEGYVSTYGAGAGGETLIRGSLCDEAIRLGRVLVSLMPQSAEVHGLLALMLLHDSRRHARLNADGELVLLEDQDRSTWDREKIREGLAVLEAALALSSPGPYQVQAAISALHAQAPSPEATGWPEIAALYDTLAAMTPSVVVEVNRAVAHAMAWGPERGLQMLLSLGPQAEGYYPYHAARADLLRRANRPGAAAAAYRQALQLCSNPAERDYLQRRLDEMLRLVH